MYGRWCLLPTAQPCPALWGLFFYWIPIKDEEEQLRMLTVFQLFEYGKNASILKY